MKFNIETLEHGRLYTLRLSDGTLLPLVAWKQTPGMPWQFLDGCPNAEVCPHPRHAHLVERPDGTFEVDCGTVPGPHDPDVRAVAEGLTMRDLRPANRLAIAYFRLVSGPRFPCSRCGALKGGRHHSACHVRNLVPLFPYYLPAEAWRSEVELGPA